MSKTKLIAFIGAHRTGKTTLAEILSRHIKQMTFRDTYFIKSQTSTVFKKLGVGITDILNPDECLFVHQAIVNDLQSQYRNYTNLFDIEENEDTYIIADRSPLDVEAYFLSRISINDKKVEDKNILHGYKKLRSSIEECLSQVDYLVYLPIAIPFERDAEKGPGGLYQEKIDLLIQGILNRGVDARIKVIKVPPHYKTYELRLFHVFDQLGFNNL